MRVPNPIFQAFGAPPAAANDGGFGQLIAQIRQLKQTFRGNPRDEVQKLLSSGRMTQEQLNQYQQMAQQIMQIMKG